MNQMLCSRTRTHKCVYQYLKIKKVFHNHTLKKQKTKNGITFSGQTITFNHGKKVFTCPGNFMKEKIK